jgi:FKBP-type peptidyl-prolyl cis-trans isomerase SlyD
MSNTAIAEPNRVIRFHYRLLDTDGNEVETSRSGEPVLALLGHGNLMQGLEQAILGHKESEQFSVTLEPEKGFGTRREDWMQRVSKKHFSKGARFQPGAQLQLQTDQGVRTVTVTKVGNKFVDVDLNHPLAGQTVTFEVELLEVREATPEELSHRHAHGAGGHHH